MTMRQVASHRNIAAAEGGRYLHEVAVHHCIACICTGLDAYCGTTVANWEIQRVVVVPTRTQRCHHQADSHVQSFEGLYEGPGRRRYATP